MSDPKTVTVWLTRAIAYVAYAFLIISEIILVQGFLLKLLGADPSADYVQWAYRSLDRVMAPFRGIFTPVEIDGNAVLDPSILFAMVIYGIVALLVRAFLDWLTFRLDKIERDRQIEEAQHAAAMAATPGAYQQAPPMPTGQQPVSAAPQAAPAPAPTQQPPTTPAP